MLHDGDNSKNYMHRKVILVFFLLSNLSFSQTDSIDAKVMRMIEVLGSTERMEAIVETMIKMQEEESPELIKSEYWQSFKNEEINYDELIGLLIPIYKKHLTIQEIETITEFYSSPIGQKMVEKFPLIANEAMQAGSIWGENLFKRVQTNFNKPLAEKFGSPTKDCSSLKKGKFRFFDNQNNQILVSRKNNIQEERINGNLIKGKIEWLNDCQYKLWNYQEDDNYEDIEPFIVTVYELTDDSYKFIYKQENGIEYFEGEMEILK